MKVPGGRALVATDIVRGYDLWPERELIDRTAAEHLQTVKRARILDVGHLVYARSDDTVARSPTMPVLVENDVTGCELGFYAAGWYSLSSPPRRRLRSIRSGVVIAGMTFSVVSG
jgi:hypothetical protein